VTLDLNDPDDAREYLSAHGSRWADVIPDREALTLAFQHFIYGEVKEGEQIIRGQLH
jgi:hypothetical protein